MYGENFYQCYDWDLQNKNSIILEEKKMEYTKKVLNPIEVPVGDFCWGRTDGDKWTRNCYHFDNEGGHPYCTLNLNLYPLKKDKEGRVLKPEKCRNLEEKKDG